MTLTRIIMLLMAALALLDGAVWEAVGIVLLVLVLVASWPPRRQGRWWLVRL